MPRPTLTCICLLTLTGFWTAGAGLCQELQLPELPQVNTTSFAPALKEQFQTAYADLLKNPRDAGANGRLGMLLQAYEQHEIAALCYERAHLLAPDVFDWKYYLGVARSLLALHQEAAAILSQAVAQRPDYIPAKLKLADSLAAIGDLAESRRIYREVVQVETNSPLAHYGLGKIEAALGQTSAAVEHYIRSCELFPHFGAAHYALGMLYRKIGEPSKARQHLLLYQRDRFGRPEPDDPLLAAVDRLNQGTLYHLKKGVDMEATGKIEGALAEHEQALKVDPRSEQVHLNLITLYGKLGQAEKARHHYETLLKLNPNLAESHYNFGVFLVSQEQFKEAAQMFRRALEINPFYAEAHNNLAYLLEQEGRLEEAFKQYQSAVEDKPNYRLAHFHLGRFLLHQRKFDEAIFHFRQTLEPADQDTPGYLYALGAAYVRKGERQAAIPYLEKARKEAAALGQIGLVEAIEKDLAILANESRESRE